MLFTCIYVKREISALNIITYLCVEIPQLAIPVSEVPISNYYAKSRSQPRFTTSIESSVNKNSRSKTNPLKAGSAYGVTASSLPKNQQREVFEPFHMFSNIHQGESFQPESQSVR